MDKKKIDAVKVEMKRLEARIKNLEESDDGTHRYWASKETGAVRRASMDLTRALAELRKP